MLLISNGKLNTRFRLVRKSTTSDDRERPLRTLRASETTTKILTKIESYCQRRRCSPITLLLGNIRFLRIFPTYKKRYTIPVYTRYTMYIRYTGKKFLCCSCADRFTHVEFLRATAYMLSAHMLSQFRPSVCPSVRPSVRPSVTRVIHAKTVVVRIVQFSPYSSPIPLVFAR